MLDQVCLNLKSLNYNIYPGMMVLYIASGGVKLPLGGLRAIAAMGKYSQPTSVSFGDFLCLIFVHSVNNAVLIVGC